MTEDVRPHSDRFCVGRFLSTPHFASYGAPRRSRTRLSTSAPFTHCRIAAAFMAGPLPALSSNLSRTLGTARVPGCAPQCAQLGSRRQLCSVVRTRSPCPKIAHGADFLRVRDHRKRNGCQAATAAAWAATPMCWLKNQFSKEMWVRVMPLSVALCIVCSSWSGTCLFCFAGPQHTSHSYVAT